MSRKVNWERGYSDRGIGNVARDPSTLTQLACGHTTGLAPVAIYPDRRKLYDCPQGCGLQKGRGRR